MGVVLPPVPFRTTEDEDVVSPNFAPAPPPPEPSSAAELELFLGLGDSARDEAAEDDEVLSLLQLESWQGVPGWVGRTTGRPPRSRLEL